MDRREKSSRRVRLNTMHIVALGFLGVIFMGVILWLPVCNQKPIEFIDALFTSVTSVCVTGLVTIVPAEQFTLFGQVVMMILIQIGGLGVIACMALFFLMLRKKITMKSRILIQEAYGLDSLSGLVKYIIRVIRGTFIVEGIGAVLLSIKFIPEFGIAKGIWCIPFHIRVLQRRNRHNRQQQFFEICGFAPRKLYDNVPDSYGRSWFPCVA